MRIENTIFVSFITIFIFIIPIGALLIESWASILVAILAIVSSILMLKSKYFSACKAAKYNQLNRDVKLLFFAFIVFGCVAFMSWLSADMSYDGWRKLGRYLRFLLLIPLICLFVRIKLNQLWFWCSVSIAALLLGFDAISDVFKYGSFGVRLSNKMNPILFGNLSLVFGAISLAGIEYFFQKNRWLIVIPILSFIAGLTASILSMSRGGWAAIPILFLISFWYFFHYQKYLKVKYQFGIVIGVILIIIAAYFIPQTGIKDRIDFTSHNVEKYFHADDVYKNTSIGQRFEMWKGAWRMFNEHPFLGVGVGKFNTVIKEYTEEGSLYPTVARFKHPHNEYLSVLANRGLVGFFSLLLVLFVPLKLFLRALSHASTDVRAFGLAGLFLISCYMVFGLSEAIFDRGLPVTLYVFYVALIYAFIRHLSQDSITGKRKKTLSVIIITKNEEDRIEACLQSVKSIADEIVVLDSGSQDRTVEIAKQYASLVEVTDWPGYGLQKQRALEKATCDWVLSIDADERLTQELRDEIDHVLSLDNHAQAYKLPWAVTIHGKRLDFGRSGRAPLRLFYRKGVRFSDAQVHEAVLLPKGSTVKTLEGRLLHFTQRDYGHTISKSAQYAWLSAQKKYSENQSGGSLLYAAFRAILTFVHIYIIRLGFLDGRVGFLSAAIYTQTNFNKYAGLWSLQQENK